MISLIYGGKGSGKTIRLIDTANKAQETNDGAAVYITTHAKHSIQIKPTIKFIDALEFGVKNKEQTLGFIKGILACNSDINSVYIDGLAYMANLPLEETKELFEEIDAISQQLNVKFVLTVSADTLPDFLQKYNK
jgi:thymidine kinase